MYECSGPCSDSHLVENIVIHKMKKKMKLWNEQINTFFNIVHKLKEMDVEITDNLLSTFILYTIPVNYENFRYTIKARGELFNPDSLKIIFFEEWERWNGKDYPEFQNVYCSIESKRNIQEQKKND